MNDPEKLGKLVTVNYKLNKYNVDLDIKLLLEDVPADYFTAALNASNVVELLVGPGPGTSDSDERVQKLSENATRDFIGGFVWGMTNDIQAFVDIEKCYEASAVNILGVELEVAIL